MGRGGSGLIDVLIAFFRFLLELIADILCTILLIAAIVAPWRVPFWCQEFETISSRNDYRLNCLYAFATSMGDIFTLGPLIVTTCSWRTLAMWSHICHHSHSSTRYNAEARLITWEHFLLLFVDIPFIIMMVIIHAAIWRIPLFWIDVYNHSKTDEGGCVLCGQTNVYHTDYRQIIFYHFCSALFDLFCLPMGIIILITGYRIRYVHEGLTDEKQEMWKRKLCVVVQFCWILFDFPFALMSLIVLLTLWRAKPLIELLMQHEDAMERRWIAFSQLVFLFRDILVFPFFLPVLLSIYRGFIVIKKIYNDVSPWAPTQAVLTVTDVKFEVPKDRTNGLLVHVTATKPSDFTLPAETDVKIFVRDKIFWTDIIQPAYGYSAAALGSTMMPFSLTPRFLDVTQLKAGSTDGSLLVDFDVSTPTTSILKQGDKANNVLTSIFQVEYGSHQGTLINLEFSIGKIREHCEKGTSVGFCHDITASDEEKRGQRLVDVFWIHVLQQFALLLIDLICIIFFFLLHLFPHRIYDVYSTGCQGSSRRHARKVYHACVKIETSVENAVDMAHKTIQELDDSLKNENCFLIEPSAYNTWVDDVLGEISAMRKYGASELSKSALLTVQHVQSHLKGYAISIAGHFPDVKTHHLFPAIEGCDSENPHRKGTAINSLNSGFPDEPIEKFDMVAPNEMLVSQLVEFGCTVEEARAALVRCNNDVNQALIAVTEMRDDLRLENPDVEREGHPVAPQFSLPCQLELTNGSEPTETSRILPKSILAAVRITTEADLQELRLSTLKAKTDFDQTKWCGGKEGWPGFREVVFSAVAELLYDFVAIVCFIIMFFSVYRTYSLLSSVIGAENVRAECVRSFLEVFIDIFYLLKFSLCFIGIRSAFTLPADLVLYIFRKPSYTVCRQVIDHHFRYFLSDLVYFFSLFFAWDAIRLLFATLAFGAFAPGIMLEGALCPWEIEYDDEFGGEDSSTSSYRYGSAKVHEKNHFFAPVILLSTIFWMLGLPFVIAYHIGPQSGLEAYVAYFSVAGFFCLLGLVASLWHRDPITVSTRRPVIRDIRPSWHNIVAYLAILMEGLQWIALAISLTSTTVFGATGETLRLACDYFFLLFGVQWDASHGLPFGAYVSLVICFLHFIIAAMPVVTGHLLHWREEAQDLTKSSVWIFSMQLLGQVSLLTVVRNISVLFHCTGERQLFFYPPLTCWEGMHRDILLALMIVFVYYMPSNVMRSLTFDESRSPSLDIVYPQLYKLLLNVGGITAVVLGTLLSSASRIASLSVIMVCAVWCLLWTVTYGCCINRDEGSCSNVKSIQGWRTALYTFVLLTIVLMLVAESMQISDVWPLYAVIGALAASILWGAVYSWIQSGIAAEENDGIDEMRRALLQLEIAAKDAQALNGNFVKYEEAAWRSQVESAARCSVLAIGAKMLEKSIFCMCLTPQFFRTRSKWLKETNEIVSAIDAERYSVNVEYELDEADWATLIICCACDACSHQRDSKSSVVEEAETKKLKKLQLIITGLRRGVTFE